MAKIVLSGSVGKRCTNADADVKAVRERLRALGFHWVTSTGAGDQSDFVRTIELFQAICAGRTKFTRGGPVDGKIGKQGPTHRWLAAQNAPGWVKIYGSNGKGWCSTVDGQVARTGSSYTAANGGYGTTWILDMVKNAARSYAGRWRPDYPLMWVRDCAKTKGGNAAGHSSHETGLDIDMRLPLKPIDGLPNPEWTFLGTRALRRQHLYREAVEAQLSALVAQPLVSVIGYEDDTAPRGEAKLHTRWGKVKPWSNHEHHFHIRIRPPTMVPGRVA